MSRQGQPQADPIGGGNDAADIARRFLAAPPIAVVGASNDLSKYGARVLAALLRHGIAAYPVNPRHESVQGVRAYPTLAALPRPVTSVSVITPPAVTEQIVEEAAQAGARILWMQPGAESPAAVRRVRALGLEVIHGGPCLLVELGLRGAPTGGAAGETR